MPVSVPFSLRVVRQASKVCDCCIVSSHGVRIEEDFREFDVLILVFFYKEQGTYQLPTGEGEQKISWSRRMPMG